MSIAILILFSAAMIGLLGLTVYAVVDLLRENT
jgi:hypothetical protein